MIAALAAAPADASPEVLADALVGAAVAHVGGDGVLADDAAVVVVRISPPPPPSSPPPTPPAR